MKSLSKEIVLSTQGLNIGYSNKKLIGQNISISLGRGELVCILGNNGSGKSTLLKTLSGQLPPSSGDITINQKSLRSLSIAERAREVAIVFTERINAEHLNVYDAIAMGRYPYTGWMGKLNCADKEIVQNTISITRLESFLNRSFDQLSDGEQQKVMIARAIAQDCPVILLDEPTAYLDMINKIDVTLLLKRLADEQQKSVVMSTHDINLALQVADKIWLMHDNSVKEYSVKDLPGSPEFNDVFKSDQFVFDKDFFAFRLKSKKDLDLKA